MSESVNGALLQFSERFIGSPKPCLHRASTAFVADAVLPLSDGINGGTFGGLADTTNKSHGDDLDLEKIYGSCCASINRL